MMELWRLRAREFLSTNDSLADASLAEALSSANSAPLKGGRRCRKDAVREEDAAQVTEARAPVSVRHLLFLQRNLWFDGQDQIRCGVSQGAHVLVDVAVHLQPDVVVHVSVVAGRGNKKPRLLITLCDICVRPRGQNRKWSTLMRNLCDGLG